MKCLRVMKNTGIGTVCTTVPKITATDFFSRFRLANSCYGKSDDIFIFV
jgi:hypothetical protein